MRRDLYSNQDFEDLKGRLNREIQRRGTFKWWDPLTNPSVGQDKSSPLSLPDIGDRVPVDDKTYTINMPSSGSIEETKNINYPIYGENPGGIPSGESPGSTASKFNVDEMKNFLVGLAKIQDVNLFYGRDEIPNLAFRDPKGILSALEAAEASELHEMVYNSASKNDPNGGMTDEKNPNYPVDHPIDYPIENSLAVMPSGETDGEELVREHGVGVYNFFDDYGAKPGDGDYHPYNRATTPYSRRDWHEHENDRSITHHIKQEGGVNTSIYGQNPRNPNPGESYRSRPITRGVPGSCNVACTGLCYISCDNECSESCTTTCWGRCGNACTSSCGNVCTGCSSMCYSSCKTKCENQNGYACLKAGSKAVKIYTQGGTNGNYASNKIEVKTYGCQGCAYTCQFYPNKKTTCWDAACMGMCFVSCTTACSTSCFGGCIDNQSENNGKSYKKGRGRGCSAGCTINCVGACKGVCEGSCINTCWHACKQLCTDNCSWQCHTNCGSGCQQGCTNGCSGCSTTCDSDCMGEGEARICTGCSTRGGCTSNCQFDCNRNCLGWGCRSICGTDTAGACESNCRLNCMNTSCTAMCGDACSAQCTNCVNSCGWQCGPCTSNCSAGCTEACNITCTATCEHSCSKNCVHSCTEECGGCSSLCYSCVGMCIGVCSVKCENGCSNCANNCSWWCDNACNQECFSNCSNRCISSCSGSCATYLQSDTQMTSGPSQPPTAQGYVYKFPRNRWEERESFKIYRDIAPYHKPKKEEKDYLVTITFGPLLARDRKLVVETVDGLEAIMYATTLNSGVFTVDQETGELYLNTLMLPGLVPINVPNIDGKESLFIVRIKYNPDIPVTADDVQVKIPFGFDSIGPVVNEDNDTIYVIQRHIFKLEDEEQ